MATTILTQDYMDAIDEQHNVVFRGNQYTEIHLLTLEIIDVLRQAQRHALSNEQADVGINACVKIRNILDDANAEKLKKFMQHTGITTDENK